ncbi:hypothetical protein BGX24_005381, partial [Mortierella sp. AD032]
MSNSPTRNQVAKPKKESLNSRLEEAARKIFGKTSKSKDKSIAGALAAVQLGAGNVLTPHDYTGSDGITQKSTTSSPEPSVGDLSNLTPATSPRASVTGSPAPTQRSLSSAPTSARSSPVPTEKALPKSPVAASPPVSSKTSTTTTTTTTTTSANTTVASTPVSKTKNKSASAPAPKSASAPAPKSASAPAP